MPTKIGQLLPGRICTPVVHNNNLVWDVIQLQLEVKVLDRGGNCAFLIVAPE